MSGIRNEIDVQYQDSGLLFLWAFLGGIFGMLVLRSFLKTEDKIDKGKEERR